ncbi:MAG TPA: hypothetical protein VMA09_04155 [Candidatus Binataceae bacterium]|nr:hypothetical protein [Candidatus Binataceae bacterium]
MSQRIRLVGMLFRSLIMAARSYEILIGLQTDDEEKSSIPIRAA